MTADIAVMKATDASTLHEGYFAAACLPTKSDLGATIAGVIIGRGIGRIIGDGLEHLGFR